jgi:UDP-2,4-diacetamido-2,4,6-trideoxy-beta-L-altropyranose hydrolase
MKKNIVFITEASPSIGIGHLARTIKLAENLKNKNLYLILFAKKNYLDPKNKNLFNKIIFCEDSKKKNLALNFIKKNNISFCIIDKINPNINFEKKLFKDKIRFLVYDNLSRSKIYANFVVNLNPKTSKKDYCKKIFFNNCRLLLGVNYFQFNNKPQKKNLNKKIKNILIFLGGGRTNYKLLIKILNNISSINDKNIKIFFVSKFAINLEKKKSILNSFNLNIVFLYNLRSLNNILRKADLAIIASGTISFEASYLNVPMILICVAKNQERIAISWAKLKAGINTGYDNSLGFSKKFKIAFKKITKLRNRIDMIASQKNIYENYENKFINIINQI